MAAAELAIEGAKLAQATLDEAPAAVKLLSETLSLPQRVRAGTTEALIVGPRKLDQYLQAVKFLGSAPGGSRALFVRASDGNAYLLKYLGNSQSTEILANEWLADPVFKYMQIESPTTAIINVSEDFIRSIGSRFDGGIKPGPAFGAQRIKGIVPSEMVADQTAKITNWRDFGKTLVTDAFLINQDGSQPLFTKSGRLFTAHMVDRGMAFAGEHNDIATVDLANWKAFPPLSHNLSHYNLLTRAEITQDIEQLQGMPDTVIKDRLSTLPPQWIVNRPQLEATVQQVLQSKSKLPSYLERTFRAYPDLIEDTK